MEQSVGPVCCRTARGLTASQALTNNTGLKAILTATVFWDGSCQPWIPDTQKGKSWRAGYSPLPWPRLPSHAKRGEWTNIYSQQQ